MRRSPAIVFGGILGAMLGLVIWIGIGVGVLYLVSYYYPAGGFFGLPSDETIIAASVCLAICPAAALAGGWRGCAMARRILARNDGTDHSASAEIRDVD